MNAQDEEAIDEAVNEIEHTEATQQDVPAIDSTDDTGLESIEDTPARASRTRKAIITAGLVVALLGIVFAVPFTRYGLVGLLVTKQVTFTVIDENNQKPVSGAQVSIGRFDTVSDAKGVATINGVAVGEHDLTITKKNYATTATTYTVPILFPQKTKSVAIKATGRTVTMTIKNRFTNTPLQGAHVDIEGATAVSDEKGVARVVVPVKDDAQIGSVKLENYNDAEVNIVLQTNDDQARDVILTPAGKVYFLSKRTGLIDVMSADLDGGNQQVVVSGTGREIDTGTLLLSSPDWKYLALISRREGDDTKLYVVAANGQLRAVEGTNASYELIGWVGAKLYYKKTTNLPAWENGAYSIVSYNAETGDTQVLDSSVGVGTGYDNMAAQYVSSAYLVGDRLVYAKYWQYSQYYGGDKNRPINVMAVLTDGNIRTTLKDIAADTSIGVDAMLRKPGVVVMRLGKNDGSKEYLQYSDGKLAATTSDDATFYDNRRSYLVSPNGQQALWAEKRDGRNVVFVAKKDLTNGSQLSVGEYMPYGWFTNDYILYSKNQSELYIAPASGKLEGAHKITDYHTTSVYPGYSIGYSNAM